MACCNTVTIMLAAELSRRDMAECNSNRLQVTATRAMVLVCAIIRLNPIQPKISPKQFIKTKLSRVCPVAVKINAPVAS